MVRVLDGADVAAVLPRPGADDDKYTRGVLGVVAGSPSYPGAGVLSTGAAMHGGAGMIRYLGLAPDEIRARYPEVVVQAASAAGRRAGAGLGGRAGPGHRRRRAGAAWPRCWPPTCRSSSTPTRSPWSPPGPGLLRARSAPTVLTPHDREFTRLGFDLGADRIGAAQHAAAELGVTMLLKGNATVVAAPDRTTYVNRTGTPWLATAGSGDVLSGIIGSLLAAGVEVTLAAAVGAHLHGVAGQLAGRGRAAVGGRHPGRGPPGDPGDRDLNGARIWDNWQACRHRSRRRSRRDPGATSRA